MPRKHYTPEQIINSLKEAEVLLSQGSATAEAEKHLVIYRYLFLKFQSIPGLHCLFSHKDSVIPKACCIV